MGRFLGKPDEGTCFYSTGVNTMNVLDQLIVSRGLLRGKAGLKARLESVSIFKHARMTTGKKGRRRRKRLEPGWVPGVQGAVCGGQGCDAVSGTAPGGRFRGDPAAMSRGRAMEREEQ